MDTAERDDVVPEDDGGGASGAVDEDSGARLPDVDTAQRDDVVPEDDGGGASGAVDEGAKGGSRTWTRPSATTWLRKKEARLGARRMLRPQRDSE